MEDCAELDLCTCHKLIGMQEEDFFTLLGKIVSEIDGEKLLI